MTSKNEVDYLRYLKITIQNQVGTNVFFACQVDINTR